jgi:hypothetical protein
MVASPADLVSGRTLSPAPGQPAAAAVGRYLDDKIAPLAPEAGIGPIQGGTGGGYPGGSSSGTGGP